MSNLVFFLQQGEYVGQDHPWGKQVGVQTLRESPLSTNPHLE